MRIWMEGVGERENVTWWSSLKGGKAKRRPLVISSGAVREAREREREADGDGDGEGEGGGGGDIRAETASVFAKDVILDPSWTPLNVYRDGGSVSVEAGDQMHRDGLSRLDNDYHSLSVFSLASWKPVGAYQDPGLKAAAMPVITLDPEPWNHACRPSSVGCRGTLAVGPGKV